MFPANFYEFYISDLWVLLELLALHNGDQVTGFFEQSKSIRDETEGHAIRYFSCSQDGVNGCVSFANARRRNFQSPGHVPMKLRTPLYPLPLEVSIEKISVRIAELGIVHRFSLL